MLVELPDQNILISRSLENWRFYFCNLAYLTSVHLLTRRQKTDNEQQIFRLQISPGNLYHGMTTSTKVLLGLDLL